MRLAMYLNGDWVDSSTRDTFNVTSPVTGQVVYSASKGTRVDAKAAIDSAYEAKETARKLPPYERARILHRIADVIESKKEDLARELSIEQGKPYRTGALQEIEAAAEMYRIAAEDIKRLDGKVMPSRDPNKTILINRVPYGVFSVITPWNYPWAIPSEYLAPGLGSGNTIVFKPSSYVVGSAVRLVQCFEEAGVPEGSVNLVLSDGDYTGAEEVGDEMVTNDKVAGVGLTGSSQTGELVSKKAGMKKLILECGGLGPMIVLDDADVRRASEAAAVASFTNSGQVCDTAERIVVHEKVYNKFLEGLLAETSKWKLGHPFEDDVRLGPMNNEPTAQKVDRHIMDGLEKGARLLVGGERATGYPTKLYYKPTVVAEVSPDMLFNKEETFGPVAPVMRISDYDEAIGIANGTIYGLQASVFTTDLKKAFRFIDEIQAGQVLVNEMTTYWEIQSPFGGIGGKKSGIGRLGGEYMFHEMTNLKTAVIDKS